MYHVTELTPGSQLLPSRFPGVQRAHLRRIIGTDVLPRNE
ncbi:hypothetical protein XA26_09580 [Mycolicibacterium fortuitum]|uniref:Uncharacterized protein n=1 Tax=Mycolicibacterium fortuitum TaxID=1766 RepID=A0A0N9XN23_MYCFO|nr:hypothetical protein G155_00071 [Mycobacterium sp. VKM Ac-1817D]ALI24818.1 hypothetical protein XA26_09580 [Mycolicibacterium fortuitum]